MWQIFEIIYIMIKINVADIWNNLHYDENRPLEPPSNVEPSINLSVSNQYYRITELPENVIRFDKNTKLVDKLKYCSSKSSLIWWHN
jgi:hypothetical protein